MRTIYNLYHYTVYHPVHDCYNKFTNIMYHVYIPYISTQTHRKYLFRTNTRDIRNEWLATLSGVEVCSGVMDLDYKRGQDEKEGGRDAPLGPLSCGQSVSGYAGYAWRGG